MRRTSQLVAAITLVAGCGGDPVASKTAADIQPSAASEASGGGNGNDLAVLRQVTAPFQDFETAKSAGWRKQITACLTDSAGAGAMGFHYGNPAFIDGSVRVDEPELLLYEPDPTGKLNLVAVEYIVPVSAWTSPNPPRLYGRDFHVISAFQVWALHVWLWKQNPSGLFKDWNPLVTCANATSKATMSHSHS